MSELFKTDLASFIPERLIGEFQATVTIEEAADDELEITSHPVQQGANITDHSYKKAAGIRVAAVYSDTPDALREKYTALLKMQSDRIPIKAITGKRTYNNMLVKRVGQVTDGNAENTLQLTFELIEVFITALEVTTLPPRAQQAQPEKTGATEQVGKKQAGAVDGQEAEKAKAEKDRSALDVFVGGFFG